MKTFGKIIALVFVLFNTACEPDDTLVKPTVPPPDNWKSVSISANLAPKVTDYGDGTLALSWRGSATSNLADKLNLSLSHQAYDFVENQNFQLQDGAFSLWTDDDQHTLSGTYTGRGYQTNGQFVMEGNIQVHSGTGRFAYENASLAFSIAHVIPFSGYPASEILIRGKLEVPAIVPVR